MQIRILGPIEVHAGDASGPVVPSGSKQCAVLGALVVRMGQVVSADRLIDGLWGEHPPANAANALQAHIARLRRLLATSGVGARIVTHSLGYVLHAGPEATDAARFLRLSAEGRAVVGDDPRRSVELLRQALGLWRGPALEGCLGDVCRSEATQLEESRLHAYETLFDASLRAGRHEEIIGELEDVNAEHPVRERFYDQLMVALYRCDRQAEALGVYERARARLTYELGVEPGPALRERVQEVLRHAPELDPPAAPRPVAVVASIPRRPAAVQGQLAAELAPPATSLDGELAQLRRGLDVLSRRQRELTERLEALTELAAAR